MTRNQTMAFIENEFYHPRNVERRPVSQCDAYGETIDSQYGVYVVTLTFNSEVITSMKWTAPKAEMYGAAIASLLSQIVPGNTIEQAYALNMTNIQSAFGIVWPKFQKKWSVGPFQALRAALDMRTKSLSKDEVG